MITVCSPEEQLAVVEKKPDAVLMALAPELLSALRVASKWVEDRAEQEFITEVLAKAEVKG
jgi:hypothetical protein